MPEHPADPFSGRLTITTAGIPQRLAEVPDVVPLLAIAALDTNTDRIYAGGVGVSAVASEQRGMPLSAREVLELENVDLASVWLDAAVSGEGVTWIARRGSTFATTSTSL